MSCDDSDIIPDWAEDVEVERDRLVEMRRAEMVRHQKEHNRPRGNDHLAKLLGVTKGRICRLLALYPITRKP